MAPPLGEGVLMRKAIIPIFIVDGLDVSAYGSLDEAVAGLEPVDIKNNAYVMYDAEGTLIRLTTDGNRITASVDDEPKHATQLEYALREFLTLMDDTQADQASCDLPCLVKACLKYISVQN
jgi:hypothetical protein